MDAPLNDAERLDQFRRLPVETEWLEFKEAKTSFDTDTLGRYVCSLSNEANLCGRDAGWLIFGIKDKIDPATGTRPVLGSRYAPNPADINELKRQISSFTAPALGLADPVEIFCTRCTPGTRVLMWRIPAALPGMPVAWKGHYYGRSGEAMGALPLNKLDALRVQSMAQDWSAVLATDDWRLLDPAAIALAQALYKRRHATHSHLLTTLQHQSVPDWLHGLRLAVNGQLTRAALVLLGKPEAASYLGGPTPRLTWVLTDHTGEIQTHQHFDLPLIMAIDPLVAKLRIMTVNLLQPRQTAPLNLPNYDDWVIREALHNCVAHQDYAQGGRVRVTEAPDSLTFFNLGTFLPGSVERVLRSRQPEQRYRNACLADAMVELDLIETLNSGLPKMFRLQKERFFPLPDFEFAQAPDSVSVRVYGKTIDENYSRLLMERSDLPLEQVIWLDRVQKKYKVDTLQITQLRKAGLIEGRKPNYFVSAHVANATDKRPEYTLNKGLDDHYYKRLILQHIQKFKSVPPPEIRALLLGKLPDSLTATQKQVKIKNLLAALRVTGLDGLKITTSGSGKGARWELVRP